MNTVLSTRTSSLVVPPSSLNLTKTSSTKNLRSRTFLFYDHVNNHETNLKTFFFYDNEVLLS